MLLLLLGDGLIVGEVVSDIEAFLLSVAFPAVELALDDDDLNKLAIFAAFLDSLKWRQHMPSHLLCENLSQSSTQQ